jgi:PAS domain S-box-containing protein
VDWSGVDAPGAVERAQDGLYATDVDGRVVYCNESFGDLVGLDPIHIRGRDAASLVAETDRDRFRAATARLDAVENGIENGCKAVTIQDLGRVGVG